MEDGGERSFMLTFPPRIIPLYLHTTYIISADGYNFLLNFRESQKDRIFYLRDLNNCPSEELD